jgi:hypothetical protein
MDRYGFRSGSQAIVLRFPNHLRRIFVVSECDELGMSQVISPGPFQELDLRDYFRAHPNALLHFLCGESLAPSAGGRLGEIRERTLRCFQVLDPLETLAPGFTSRLSQGVAPGTSSIASYSSPLHLSKL